MLGLRGRLTYPNVMASIAVFVSLGGGAYAATGLPRNSVGGAAIRSGAVKTRDLGNGAVTAEKVAVGSLTGRQIDVAQLGTVPSADHANTADSATTATNADHATTSDSATSANTLGGLAPSAFQSRVTGACANNTALTQINADGSVSCTNPGTYAVRVVTPLLTSSPSSTLLTIPGLAHLRVFECSSNQAAAIIVNDSNADLWFENSSETDYDGSTWVTSSTSQSVADSISWHLSVGTGTGTQAANVNVSYAALGTSCVFQVTAEVFTAN